MPFVPIPKDLTKVKTKVVFNLTQRQLICFGLGALIGVPIYLYSKNVVGDQVAMYIMIVIMSPFFMFAMYEKNGQPLEKLLRYYILAKFVNSAYRPYRTGNIYTALDKLSKEEETQNVAKKRKPISKKGNSN